MDDKKDLDYIRRVNNILFYLVIIKRRRKLLKKS